MKKLVRFIFKNGKYKIALSVLAIGFVLQALLIFNCLPEFLRYSDNVKNPDQFFTYNREYIVDLYQKLGEEGRSFYIKMLTIDFFYTTISGLGFSLLLAALVKKEKWYIVLPLLLTLSDVFENIMQMVLMNDFPVVSTSKVFVSSTFSSIKMIGGAVSLSMVLFFIGKNIFNWAKSKNART